MSDTQTTMERNDLTTDDAVDRDAEGTETPEADGKAAEPSARSQTRSAPAKKAAAPKKKSLSNNAFNFIVDCIMLVSGMCVLAATMVLAFVFPAPSQAAGYSIWGYGYDGWARFLIANISIFLVLILLHIILHWVWVCMFVTSRLGKRLGRRITLDDSAKTIWGVFALIVVLTIVAVFVGVASFSLVEPG